MRRKSARCWGVASDRRQDQASGTLMTRPSARCAMISSPVTRTCWMRGSVLATMFIPCLQYHCAMGVDEPADDVQLSGAEAVATSQLDRLEPELAGAVLSLDVHVRRPIAVEAAEEDPIRPRDALDSWHCGLFAPLPIRSAIVPGGPWPPLLRENNPANACSYGTA